MVLTTGGKHSPMKSGNDTTAHGDTSAQGDVVVERSIDETTAAKPVADSTLTPPEAPATGKASVSVPRSSDKKHPSLNEPTGGAGVDVHAATPTRNPVRSRPEISKTSRKVVDVAVDPPSAPQAVKAVTAATDVPPQANYVAPAISTAPEEPAPPQSVSRTVLGVLASVGSGPLATDSPMTPLHSPLELALAAVGTRPRRPAQAVAASSTPTSQSIDGVASLGVQGDQQALAKTSTTQLSAPLTVDAANMTAASQTLVQRKAATQRTKPDTTAPTVSLTGPANGATVSGAVAVTATASDSVGVTAVQFKLDGANLGTQDTVAPYSLSWDTTAVSNGPHTLTAVARDAAGNTRTSASLTVTVNNADTTAPKVSLTGPANGATVSGTVNLTATATDNVTVTKVQFMDGTTVIAEDTSSVGGWGVSWNTATAANSTHTLTARAFDAAGNQTSSAPVSVTVASPVADTTAPTVSLTGPANGATVSGTVNLTATATDNVGVTKVQFFWGKPSGVGVNLNLLAEDTTAPYGPVSWDSTAAVNGPNMLLVQAFDAAGNSTMRSINVIVNNPANNLAPVVPGKTIPRTFDPVTGAVTGVLNVRDPEQAQLSYTLAYPPSRGGTVSFDQPTGVFTYTPSQAARDQAAGTSGLDYDTFGVSISDGIATVQTSVTVQVAQTLPPTTSITNTPVTAGSGPSGAAVAGGFAYVINYDSNNVTVINTATNQFVKTLDVGTGPLSVTANPQGNRVYVSNSMSNTVSVIDATTNTVIGAPISINVLPGSYYNTEVSYYPIDYPNRVTEVAASGNRLYVNATDGRITVIDTTNDANVIVGTAPLGTFSDLKVSPDGTRLYGTRGGGLTVINTATMTATAIPVGPTWNSQLLRNEYVNSVGNVAVSPDGKRAYVTFGATIAERGVGGQSNGSFFTDAQGVSWMVTGGYSGVSVIDTDPTSSNFNKEIARIIVPLGVHDVAASGNSLYVTSGDGKTVTVINTVTNTLAGMFTTDQTASGGRAIEIMVYPYGDEYPEYGISAGSITAFTRYITVGPNGTVYVSDYTDGKAYAVTVGTAAV
jgi:YVTN family beta-propeller protein